MPTEKQIAANRLNALKSTGPRTEDGKANSARNGPRHRRLMKAVVLATESQKSFRATQNWFHNEYHPDGPTELMLVNVMIAASWRLNRLWSVERAGIDHELDRQLTPGASPAFADLDFILRTHLAMRALGDNRNPLESWSRSELRLERQFRNAHDTLMRLRLAREKRTEAEAKTDAALLFEEISPLSNPLAIRNY